MDDLKFLCLDGNILDPKSNYDKRQIEVDIHGDVIQDYSGYELHKLNLQSSVVCSKPVKIMQTESKCKQSPSKSLLESKSPLESKMISLGSTPIEEKLGVTGNNVFNEKLDKISRQLVEKDIEFVTLVDYTSKIKEEMESNHKILSNSINCIDNRIIELAPLHDVVLKDDLFSVEKRFGDKFVVLEENLETTLAGIGQSIDLYQGGFNKKFLELSDAISKMHDSLKTQQTTFTLLQKENDRLKNIIVEQNEQIYKHFSVKKPGETDLREMNKQIRTYNIDGGKKQPPGFMPVHTPPSKSSLAYLFGVNPFDSSYS